ncbi:MAG: ABC transporter ATP-binding protein [Bacteroidetes bacterium]|nr:ABC transporter ATP-binding protein [Bacteroidota bacterium]
MISIKNIEKAYNERKALYDFSLEISKGEFFGILGPNGAGKTTLIQLITGILIPDNGKIFVNGASVSSDKRTIASQIGVVPQDIALYNSLTALQNLLFWGGFYSVNKTRLKSRAYELLEKVGLLERANSRVGTFSGGMKRRINLAVALMHNPAILIMDEPTVGIDPQSRNLIHNLLNEIHTRGCTILYTSHYLDEFEKLCDKIAIMDKGVLVAEGNIDELRRKYAPDDLVVVKLEKPVTVDTLQELFNGLLIVNLIDSTTVMIRTDGNGSSVEKIIHGFSVKGLGIVSLEVRKSNLENVFFNLTGLDLRD